MHAIYEALKKTGGKTDGDSLIAAAKGLKWDSPRGPMSIDPETRDVVQTIYIRKVEKVGGELRQRAVRQGRERQGSGRGRAAEANLPAADKRIAAAEGAAACSVLSPLRTCAIASGEVAPDRMLGRKRCEGLWLDLPPSPRRSWQSSPAHAQQTVKIGVIMSFSGQFADPGAQIDNGIKLYMKQHGDTVAGRKIEIIRKDTGGIAPDVAKRLAQELIVRDKVDILAGFSLTPNALAAADVSAQAKKFMVNMNAATSVITTKSPYMVRTSFTVPQLNEALGTWAYKNGVRKVYTLVSDFGPGHDGEAAFHGASRTPAARSSARRAIRSPIPTSPPSCSAPRTSIRTRSTSGCRAARSRRRSARRWPSAASTRARPRSWARAS